MDATLKLPDEMVDLIAEQVTARLGALLADAGLSPWLDVPGAAKYLCRSPDAIYGLVKAGKLRTYKPDGRLLFHRDDLDSFVRGVAA